MGDQPDHINPIGRQYRAAWEQHGVERPGQVRAAAHHRPTDEDVEYDGQSAPASWPCRMQAAAQRRENPVFMPPPPDRLGAGAVGIAYWHCIEPVWTGRPPVLMFSPNPPIIVPILIRYHVTAGPLLIGRSCFRVYNLVR